ncbi:MAG: cytidylate kinase, partial [Treponema sp. GWC1_61_84]
MVIAIDGPAGSGKSTIARHVAERLGFVFVNSGKFYRALTLACLRSGVDLSDPEAVLARSRTAKVRYRNGRVQLDGEDVDGLLQSDDVDRAVAPLSAIVPVRHLVNALVRKAALGKDIVVEGRDITTVVFPDAEHKFYLDASAESRALRRFKQGTSSLPLEEIRKAIEERDGIDRNKAEGSLKVAPDAVYLDTSDLTIDQVYDKLVEKIQLQGSTMGQMEVEMGGSKRSADNIQTQLQEEYLKSLEQLEEGQLVDGVVIQVTEDQVFIDVGYKSEGKIPIAEFTEIPKIGDQVSVVLIAKENKHGEVIVSKQKADVKVFWKNLRQAFQDHAVIEGTIDKVVKGGYDVNLGSGVRAFLPISQSDAQKVDKPEKLLEMKTSFYIERLYSDGKVNIVVNRRKWLEEEIEKRREAFYANTQIGDEVVGAVKSFTSFGSFIDLGGFDGLLHINDMSWGHVTRPKDFVKKGQEIRLKVIRIDPVEKRINLSLKHFTDDPWIHFEDKYHVNDVVKGHVTKLTDFGAFIELEEGIEGLAHISEFSWIKKIQKPEEILKIGDE